MSMITPDAVLAALSRHIGAERGVSVRELTREVLEAPGEAADERAVRHAIQELRERGHHVCAHPSTGYFLAATDEELNRTCLYLTERAMCSLRQVAAMKKVSLPDLKGQLRLPT